MNWSARAKRVKAVVLDVDGVLTDGRIGYAGDGCEIKFFDVKDGLGIKLLQRAGIAVGIVSGRESRANRTRAEELGLDFVRQGVRDKRQAVLDVAAELGVSPEECCCVGDDLVDVPMLRVTGFRVAVADATDVVKQYCDMVTNAPGGRGAVRETARAILKEQGKWDELIRRFVEE